MVPMEVVKQVVTHPLAVATVGTAAMASLTPEMPEVYQVVAVVEPNEAAARPQTAEMAQTAVWSSPTHLA